MMSSDVNITYMTSY